MGCIYAHLLKDENSQHYGWTYIGQAEDIDKRWSRVSNYKGSPYIYNAFKKYGWDAFDHIILEDNVDINALNERETYWIKYYHTFIEDTEYNGGFNLTSGGDGTRGPKLSLRGKTPKNIPYLSEMKKKKVTVLNSGIWNNIPFKNGQTWDSVDECAKCFNVSHTAITFRIYNYESIITGPIFVFDTTNGEQILNTVRDHALNEKERQRKSGKQLSLNHKTGSHIDYIIRCEETGQEFEKVSDCLKAFDMARSTLNGHLNYPDKHKTAKGYHFMRVPITMADS